MSINYDARIRQLEARDHGREDRYHCLQCRDTGWVTIWHPSAIQKAVKDVDAMQPKDWHTCVALCECPKADTQASHFSESSRHSRAGKPIPKFGEQAWHIATRGPDDTESKAAAACYQHRPEGFNTEFEEF